MVINGKTLNCAGGDCRAFNINYGARCMQCSLAYLGKTVQALRTRIAQHRGFIVALGASTDEFELSDENTLAAHALEHGVRTKADFNELYKFFVVKYVEKEMLTISEQELISRYNTVRPYGLNVSNPLGIPSVFRV